MELSTPTKVGIFVLIALLALALVITWKSNLFLRAGGYELVGSFRNIEGLTIGSEVRYRGYKVGKVVKVDPGPEDIKIYSIVNRGIRIPDDSSLRVAFDGLVGLKYLSIRPGKSSTFVKPGAILDGKSTAGIVDFVDVGTQSMVEVKKILENILLMVEDSQMQNAFKKAVINIEKITEQLESTSRALNNILSDKNFQANIKGTIGETKKTLASANSFFESFAKIHLKPSGDVYFGNKANTVRANLDVAAGEKDYYRMSIGEGPTQNLSILDLLIARQINAGMGLKLGMINTKLGGGLDFFLGPNLIFSTDIYDINNKPGSPKLRLTSEFAIRKYVSFNVQADDILNSDQSNYAVGISVKGN